MNKILVIAFLLLTTVVKGGEKDEFQFGMRMGLNLADQRFEGKKEFDDLNDGSWKFLPGFTLGFMAEIPLASFLEIRAEALVTSMGRQFVNKTDKDNWIKSKIAYGYVQFPVMAKLQLGGENIRGFVNFGPQFGVGVYGLYRDKFAIDGEKDTENEGFKFKDEDLKRFDLGLSTGIGLEMKNKVEFEVRYTHGFSDIVDWEATAGGERPDGVQKFTNQGLAVTFGYKF